MFTRGELARARSPNSDFPARAPDSTQGRRHDQHVESAPRVLFASAPRFPQSEASGYVCPSTSCGFSCASSLRGGCSTGASHQSRSRSLNAGTSECKADQPPDPRARSRDADRLRRALGTDAPPPTSVSKSPAERRPTPLLRVAKPTIPQPIAATPLARRLTGEMWSSVLGESRMQSPQEGCKPTSAYGHAPRPDAE